ncbi:MULTISPECIES: sulfite dehydrogenase [unclassified Polaromonas]|uniref:sulfite dehydrogenase n=1 Tax=unclassified Polaromonas TaxID=2638319 RepID=UPI0018CB665A|nr:MULTISPECIES: sulfite dehydrogenase [unclassified Polaromonas]MBG6073751.1 sulfane dehydrogenase subunit SoxC [Polaromonas sp. CG_9.7]MBG6115805.1 sulfane dehydrogenase subunit SoxC [Polaromonas sp. CG_9.2]MDH6186707.1 sulfane dehydrogenase subunit SoxC [Polaromonas sp. CG_23.6]
MENRTPAATADAERMRSLRRRFLINGTAAIVGAAGTARAAAPLSAVEREVPADATKIQGYPLEDSSYGSRSQFETEVRTRFKTATPQSSWTLTPLQNSIGIITPSGLHFERSHGGTAVIDPAKHMLYVHGMVKQPRKFTMADIRRFPSLSRIMFIECSGNGLTEWSKPTLKTVQGTHGLTSCSEWTGVPLATVLREAGLRTDAKWLLAEGGDASVMTRSIPMAKALKDCLVAYGQNGEALRPEQGYPLRLIVPGYEGNTHIKWLRRIEVSDTPFMTREETSKYTDLMPNGKAVQFSFEMDAKSVITSPSGEMQLDGPGFQEITGLAWSGRGAIKKVEVSTNGGATWKTAALQGPFLPICHTRFRLPWRWDGKAAILQSRCTDDMGYVQPTLGQVIAARGGALNGPTGSIYHLNAIQSWQVANDGKVSNVHHY